MEDGDWGSGVGDSIEDGVLEPGADYGSRVVRSFRDLDVWRDGISLAEIVYLETRAFPPEEKYGLTSQLRRAAVAVPSNIAEGWGRSTRKDYVRFLHIARGSLFEVATQIEIAQRVDLLDAEAAERIEAKGALCGKRLSRLMAALTRPQSPIPNP